MNTRMKWLLLAMVLAALALLVPSPALAYGWTPYGACVALGVLAALLLARGLLRREAMQMLAKDSHGRGTIAASIGFIGRIDPLELTLCVVPAALVCARLSYCLVRFSYYFLEMNPLSVLKIWEGGFLLYGAVLGALGAAALLAKKRHVSAAAALDELAAPGLLAIAIARLGEWTTGEGVGAWIENEALMRFPIAVMNEYEEWQLAVFLFEAVAALILLIPVLRERTGRGERFLTALLLFGACQIVLESLRMDSCLKIGFVRISQVASGAAVLLATVIRAYRAGGRRVALRRAAVIAVCIAVVGGVEWALDKTPVSNVILYLVMIAVCVMMMACGLRLARQE